MADQEKLFFELYVNQDMGITKIAQHLGISARRVRTAIEKYKIPKRPFHQKGRGNRKGAVLSLETRKKISRKRMGFKVSEHTKQILRDKSKGWYMNNGYMFIRKLEHPLSYKHEGYIKRANLILEEKIGRYMKDGELAHHINHIRDDDRPENLELKTTKQHNTTTAKDRWASGELRQILCKKGKVV
jgi:transposase